MHWFWISGINSLFLSEINRHFTFGGIKGLSCYLFWSILNGVGVKNSVSFCPNSVTCNQLSGEFFFQIQFFLVCGLNCIKKVGCSSLLTLLGYIKVNCIYYQLLVLILSVAPCVLHLCFLLSKIK